MKACRKHMIDTFCLSPKLQRQHENMDAHTMIMHVKDLFEQTSRSERHETFKKLFHYKMTEGSSVNIIFWKLLAILGFVIDHELSFDLVLQSLPQSFSQFIMNYHINKLDSTLSKFLDMFRTLKRAFKEEKCLVFLVQSSRMSKKNDKKNKGVVS